MIKALRPALTLLLLLTFITGCLYPTFIWALGQSLFPYQANGSLIKNTQGKTIGSEILGQSFTDERYFWSRPSAHNSKESPLLVSGARNLPPAHPLLLEAIKKRASQIREAHNLQPDTPLPSDIVSASASGLDPHISPEAALLQAKRIATARHRTVEDIEMLITRHTTGRLFGFIGQRRVNVLKLNMALDAYMGETHDR